MLSLIALRKTRAIFNLKFLFKLFLVTERNRRGVAAFFAKRKIVKKAGGVWGEAPKNYYTRAFEFKSVSISMNAPIVTGPAGLIVLSVTMPSSNAARTA